MGLASQVRRRGAQVTIPISPISKDLAMQFFPARTRIGVASAASLSVAFFLSLIAGCDRAQSADGRPRVGAILMQQDQFFRMNEQGMRAAALELGVDLRVQNAGDRPDREIAVVDAFMTQRIDAILLSPLNSSGSVPALRRAHDRGIKIITYNNSIDADFPVCVIASDQNALGASSGRAVRQYVEKNLGGKARVAMIGFASQLPEQGGARALGFKSALAGAPGIEIVAEQDAWEADQAASTAGELLTKHPDIIWAANEGGTVGAVVAVRNAGKAGKIAVFGTDVSKQLLDFLLADEGILHAVTAQKPFEMGYAALEAAVKSLRGETAEKVQVLPGVLFHRDDPGALREYRRRLEDLTG